MSIHKFRRYSVTLMSQPKLVYAHLSLIQTKTSLTSFFGPTNIGVYGLCIVGWLVGNSYMQFWTCIPIWNFPHRVCP